MSRAALRALGSTTVVAVLLLGSLHAGSAAGLDPHLDPSLVPSGCSGCHAGHGAPRSPMLRRAQLDVCLTCHGSRSDLDRAVARGLVSPTAEPPLIGRSLSQPYAHPVSQNAFSRREPGAVTCSSCHAPHRGGRGQAGAASFPGQRRRSHRDPSRFEFELCQDCHGNRGSTTQSLTDVSRLTNPANRSYHPVEAPAREPSPSVVPSLSGGEINCTDCHGDDDSTGPRGVHGSAQPFILRSAYATVDGSTDPATAYALCFECHDLRKVMDESDFEEHGRHVVTLGASCANCHAAHGSVENRALIRFDEGSFVGSAGPSLSTGRLAFESPGPGSGTCYLTCHGVDHAPEGYGDFDPVGGAGTGPTGRGVAPR